MPSLVTCNECALCSEFLVFCVIYTLKLCNDVCLNILWFITVWLRLSWLLMRSIVTYSLSGLGVWLERKCWPRFHPCMEPPLADTAAARWLWWSFVQQPFNGRRQAGTHRASSVNLSVKGISSTIRHCVAIDQWHRQSADTRPATDSSAWPVRSICLIASQLVYSWYLCGTDVYFGSKYTIDTYTIDSLAFFVRVSPLLSVTFP